MGSVKGGVCGEQGFSLFHREDSNRLRTPEIRGKPADFGATKGERVRTPPGPSSLSIDLGAGGKRGLVGKSIRGSKRSRAPEPGGNQTTTAATREGRVRTQIESPSLLPGVQGDTHCTTRPSLGTVESGDQIIVAPR